MRDRKRTPSLTEFFKNEFIKEAQGEPGSVAGTDPGANDQAAQAAMQQQQMQGQGQPPGPNPATGEIPSATTNSMRQSGLPTTAIVCTSDCRYAQNQKGMCTLNKINFSQVQGGMIECQNYEPAYTEQVVLPPDPSIPPQGI